MKKTVSFTLCLLLLLLAAGCAKTAPSDPSTYPRRPAPAETAAA
jgi:hypothetical protein